MKQQKEQFQQKDLSRQIYRYLLDVSYKDSNFEEYYQSRKELLNDLGNPNEDLDDFCKVVLSKGKEAIYYITDNTQKEKELVFYLLDKYCDEYKKEEVLAALQLVYPDLYNYLTPYRFNNELLDSYFQDYKYQKVVNRIFPEFEDLIIEQATKREYNLILEARSSKIESIDRSGAHLYFVDALGVEYLSYIMSICKQENMMANVTICRCELPSITSANKEFFNLFDDDKIVKVKYIDNIKHHGKDNHDYQQTKLPIHLSEELDIIRKLLQKIKERLGQGNIQKAIIASDHGASRLAVIHETESIWEMSSKGEHSGRCCLKSEVDEQPVCAVDAGDFGLLQTMIDLKVVEKQMLKSMGVLHLKKSLYH